MTMTNQDPYYFNPEADTTPSESEVVCSVLLVPNDKPFICVHQKDDYFSDSENRDAMTFEQAEVSRFDTLEEMESWISKETEGNDKKGHYYGRNFIIYAGRELAAHKDHLD